MPTIEDKLDELERLRGGMRATVEDIRYPAAKAAIIEIWNAAEKAIKAEIGNRVQVLDDSVIFCLECDCFNAHKDSCTVGALQAALARMEGEA